MALIVAIEQGGTHGRVLVYEEGYDDPTARGQFEIVGDQAGDLLSFVQLIKEKTAGEPVKAIGFSYAGKINPQRTGIEMAGTLSGSVGLNLVKLLGEVFRCPVALLNDGEAGAMAEAAYGYGRRNKKNFYYVIWGTGIGGCYVWYDERGTYHMISSEVGHAFIGGIRMDREPLPPPHRCGCGRNDCIEAFASGRGIHERYGMPASELDPEADKADWHSIDEAMAGFIRGLASVVPIEHIVFGGGVALGQGMERLESIQKLVPPYSPGAPTLSLAHHREDNGLVGAWLAARKLIGA